MGSPRAFVGNARIPLDNNASERGIRGPVVGRRNHCGSKSKDGTEVAAVFYTLLETAKLCVDPARYLREAALADTRGKFLLPHELADRTAADVVESSTERLAHAQVTVTAGQRK